jgi:hypothetical protein
MFGASACHGHSYLEYWSRKSMTDLWLTNLWDKWIDHIEHGMILQGRENAYCVQIGSEVEWHHQKLSHSKIGMNSLRKGPKWPLERPSLISQQWVAQAQAWHSDIPLFRNSIEFSKHRMFTSKKDETFKTRNGQSDHFVTFLCRLCAKCLQYAVKLVLDLLWALLRSEFSSSAVRKPQFNARQTDKNVRTYFATKDSTDRFKRADGHRTRSCISREILSSTSLATQEIPKIHKMPRDCR